MLNYQLKLHNSLSFDFFVLILELMTPGLRGISTLLILRARFPFGFSFSQRILCQRGSRLVP